MSLSAGLDKWFPLTPISREDEVQGEVLVELGMEYHGEVRPSVILFVCLYHVYLYAHMTVLFTAY